MRETNKIKDLYVEERQAEIIRLMRKSRKVSVSELSRQFQVSSTTIRGDLHILEQRQLLVRTHGGAILTSKTGFELSARQKEAQNLPLKRRIAKAAVELIKQGDVILLDTGTTTFELALLLQGKKNITLVTNDLPITLLLEDVPGINIVLAGGILRRGFHCTISVQGNELCPGLTVDKAFMATNGFSFEYGATTPDLHQAQTKKRMIAMATEVILLCDSTKIGRTSFAQFAMPDDIGIFITDDIKPEEKEQFIEYDVEVIVA